MNLYEIIAADAETRRCRHKGTEKRQPCIA